MKKVSRSDKQYKEIEKFKDYELTQCIAYEMAIRNPEIKELIVKRDAADIMDDFDEKWMDKINKISTKEEESAIMMEFLDDDPKRQGNFLLHEEMGKSIKLKCFFAIPKQSKSIINESMTNKHYVDYVSRGTQRVQASKSTLIDNDSIKTCFVDNGTVATNTGGTIHYSELFPELSRPLPIIPGELSKEIDLPINLELPVKDILAYIETIKDNYDNSKGEIFQVVTPLTDISKIDKEIFSIQIKVKKRGSGSSLDMPEKSQQEVYADLFFLYDVFYTSDIQKQGDKIQYFQNEMIDYYAKKVCKYHKIKDIDDVSQDIGTPRDQTVREYVKMMKYYIDDYGYKKLLV